MKTHRSAVKALTALVDRLLVCAAIVMIAGCGGGGGDDAPPPPPTNVGGGYTLMASGGTLNDGSGIQGLVVLATIRDSQGWGPLQTWTVTITGPGIAPNYPLAVEYADPRHGSYVSWEWAGWDPVAGTYRISATNGTVIIYRDFSVTSNVINRPAPNAGATGNDISITWPAVPGAGSYGYDACSPAAVCISGMVTGTTATATFASLANGDYSIQVRAYATDRTALFANHVAAPSLAARETVSEYAFTYPVGTTVDPANIQFKVAGGVLDYDLSGSGGPVYGLTLWTSLRDVTNMQNPVPPAGDWNIIVTDPNGFILNYIYPAGAAQHANWYYGIEPVAGSYTVIASYGASMKSATFTILDPGPHIVPLDYTVISSALVSNQTDTSLKDVSITWPAVTNAHSYYVGLWGEIWNTVSKQYDYVEVWGEWVATPAARIVNGSVPPGLAVDVYVTACEADMTSATPMDPAPSRADMSENYYGYPVPFPMP